MNFKNKQFYIGTLSQEKINILNGIVNGVHFPNDFDWSDYPLPDVFKCEIQDFVNAAREKRTKENDFIQYGTFQPIPTKAPPPKYVRNGPSYAQIMGNYISLNGNETLLDTNFYSFTVQQHNSKGIKVVVNYSLEGFEITGFDLSQMGVLHDAPNTSSSPIQNNLIIMKLQATSGSSPTSTDFFELPSNPTRLSIAPMINVPSSIFDAVNINHKSFHIYPFV